MNLTKARPQVLPESLLVGILGVPIAQFLVRNP